MSIASEKTLEWERRCSAGARVIECPNCGTENPDSVAYCQKCAHELKGHDTTEPKLPMLWMLGTSMIILGIVLHGLYWMGAVTGLMAGPTLVAGGALFLAGLITWRIHHKREN